MRLEGQVAIITGVSHAGQVGYGLAAAFAREGALLAILTTTFAKEGKQLGISVNALGPGLKNIVEAAIFLLTPARDGVNGVVLPVQGKGI